MLIFQNINWKFQGVLLLFTILCTSYSIAQENESELFRKADQHFEAGDFYNALPVFEKLLAIKPNNTIYNAKYGVCLLNTDTNKASSIKHLYFAATQPETSPLAIYYLARAFHINYKFDEAITYYSKFKAMVAEKDAVKYDAERLMEMCKNGKMLTGKAVETDFYSRKMVSREFFTNAYDLLLNEAKIYSIPEDFKSDLDKQQNVNTVMCLYNQENEAVYPSYGKTLKRGKDICRKIKFGNEWSKAKAYDDLNSDFDEDFPFVVADGNLIFFSSKGFNSMGGYDIFKSVWNQQTESWSRPENLGYPVNSPGDDFLFIPDKISESAYFASDRSSPFGKIEIFRIKYPKELGSLAIIKGKFQVVNNSASGKAQITVIDVVSDKLEGIYNTHEKTGNYIIALTPGGKYKFTIRVKGFAEHSFVFDVPVQESKFDLKQLIRIEKDFQNETVIAYNFFKEEEADIISDNLFNALSEANPPPEFTDLLDHHTNVAISEMQTEKKTESELVPLAHRKDGKKTKADEAYDEAFQSFEKKKQQEADIAFKLGDYLAASKLYSELLNNSPGNTINNYRFGICLFNTEKDKAKALPYFKNSLTSAKIPADVYFYLALIYHLAGQFEQAIENYTKYSTLSSAEEIKNTRIERKIENCINGKMIMAQIPEYEIINKKNIAGENIHQAFNAHEFSGKILLTPDDFRSDIDKKNNFKSTMFLTFDNKEIYYSSYGPDSKNGKDIYKRVKLSNGEWGQAQYQVGINTPYDEDFPFVAPSGTIYFCSEGFNSMGGYDIFLSEWNERGQNWDSPHNMGPPVNSTADDIYFIRCKDGVSGYFSSSRLSLPGQMELFNVRKVITTK